MTEERKAPLPPPVSASDLHSLARLDRDERAPLWRMPSDEQDRVFDEARARTKIMIELIRDKNSV